MDTGYTNVDFFNENVVVRKSDLTDEYYFHRIDLTGELGNNKSAVENIESKKQDLSPCDPNYVGNTITYTSAANLTLNEFLRDLQKLHGISFIVDKDVPDDSVTVKILDKPWNNVLEAILRSKNLEARCLSGDIISIEPKGKQLKLDQENEKNEPLVLRKYTIRYIPLNSSNTAQIAGSVGGSSNGGGGNSGIGIEGQINQLLTRSGDNRSSVSRVPNSNILAVYATEKQQQEIDEFIKGIDQPGFQVIIETNFYTVNESKFNDLGGQFSVIVGNGLGTQIGGITNLPPSSQSGGTGGTTDNGGQNPGNVSGLPSGFGTPNNNLRANGNTLFGGSFTVGTATFNVLFSAAQQRGLANSQARSTQAVLDGGTTEIRNGDTIIIPTTGAVGGSLVNSGAITVNATQSAALQPQVVVDKEGNPIAVTLNLQLTNNAINRAFLGTSTPVVATQSQSGTVRLPLNQTYVVSGFFTDSVVNTKNNTPGLSKIPGLGELFKRRTDQIDRNRLYFAISVRVVRDTDLMQIPSPSDIDTRPVPAPDPQKPNFRDDVNKTDKKKKKQ
jgi:type IV pilus assembly protein PilQ